MPNTIHLRRMRESAAAVSSGALLPGAVPAAANAACTPHRTSNVFTKFGDTAAYSPLQGGSFESGAPGWSLTNAAVCAGNESWGHSDE